MVSGSPVCASAVASELRARIMSQLSVRGLDALDLAGGDVEQKRMADTHIVPVRHQKRVEQSLCAVPNAACCPARLDFKGERALCDRAVGVSEFGQHGSVHLALQAKGVRPDGLLNRHDLRDAKRLFCQRRAQTVVHAGIVLGQLAQVRLAPCWKGPQRLAHQGKDLLLGVVAAINVVQVALDSQLDFVVDKDGRPAALLETRLDDLVGHRADDQTGVWAGVLDRRLEAQREHGTPNARNAVGNSGGGDERVGIDDEKAVLGINDKVPVHINDRIDNVDAHAPAQVQASDPVVSDKDGQCPAVLGCGLDSLVERRPRWKPRYHLGRVDCACVLAIECVPPRLDSASEHGVDADVL